MGVVLSGADEDYLTDSTRIDADLSIDVRVPTVADRQAFRAQLDLIALDDAGCANVLRLPRSCVLQVGFIDFAPEEIGVQTALFQKPTKRARIRLSDAGVDDFDRFTAEQALAGRQLRLRLLLDIDDVFASDPDPANDTGTSKTLVGLRPLSGRLFFGAVETRIQSVDALGTACSGARGFQVSDLVTEWIPSGDGSWPAQTIDFKGQDCVALQESTEGVLDLALTAGSETLFDLQGELGGLAIQLASVQLDTGGVTPGPLHLDLPGNTSFHLRSSATGLPRPRGESRLSLSGARVPPSGELTGLRLDADLAAAGMIGFLQPGSTPIAFEVESLTLDADGLTAPYQSVHYAYDMPFAANDPRGTRGAPSNDARMRLPTPAAGQLVRIDAGGLQAEASFAAGSGDTHYPRTEASFDEFDLVLAQSRFAAGQVLAAGPHQGYAFDQNPDCPVCPDTGSLPPVRFDVQPTLAQGVAADGAVVAFIDRIDENAAWGPDAGSARIFERLDDADQPGVLFLPGFAAEGTADPAVPVVDYLRGARAARIEGGALLPGAHHLLRSDQSRAGNHFRAGLNIGPERLIAETGSPDVGITSSLDGLRTRIGFGGALDTDFTEVAADVGSKLVLRAGGVTGVLGSQMPPQPTVYGYQLALERFAFRQIANEIDPASWVGGVVHVPAPADFAVTFDSLAFECTGDIGDGVLREDGPAQRLLAWQTGYGLQRAKFVPPEGTPACEPTARSLRVAGVAGIRAFDQNLTVEADWRPDGIPENERIEGSTHRKLDRPANPATPEDDLAMPFMSTSGIGLRLTPQLDQGWFQLKGLIEHPFWEPFEVDLRLQNRSLDEPAQTLVFRQDSLFEIAGEALVGNDDEDLVRQMETREGSHTRAVYDWVGSIDFDLPIYYDAGRHAEGRMPRFLGLARPLDIKVFDADARADFVTPVSTAISFGASAQFNRLAEEARALHVDLNDPQSVAAIDSFLHDYLLVPENPISTMIAGLGDVRARLECYNEPGFDLCLEQALKKELREALTDPAQNMDPDSVSQQLRQAYGQGFSGVIGAYAAVDDASNDLRTDPNIPVADTGMVDLYNLLPLSIKNQQAVCAPGPSVACNAWLLPLQGAWDLLGLAKANLINMQTNVLGPAQANVAQIRTNIPKIQTILDRDIPPVIEEVKGLREELMETGLDACEEGNLLLAEIGEYRDSVIDIKDRLAGIEKLWLLAESLGFDGDETEQTRDMFLRLVADMDTILAPALDAAGKLLQCEVVPPEEGEEPPPVDLADVMVDAEGYLIDVETALQTLLSEYDAFRERMLEDADGNGIRDDEQSPPAAFIGVLGRIERQLADIQNIAERFTDPGGWLDDHSCAMEQAIPNNWPPSAIDPMATRAPGCTGLLPNDVSPYPLYSTADVPTIQLQWDAFVLASSAGNYRWAYPPQPSMFPVTNSFVQVSVNNTVADLAAIRNEINTLAVNGVWPALAFIPVTADGWDLIEHLTDLIMNREVVAELVTLANKDLGPAAEKTIELTNNAMFLVSALLRQVLETLGSLRDDYFELDELTVVSFSPVSRIDEVDGHALITGPDMERVHLSARLDFLKEIKDDLLESLVTVDIERWSSQGITSSSCQPVVTDQLLDILIQSDRAFGDNAKVFGKRTSLDSLFARVSMQSGELVGLGLGLGIAGSAEYRQFGLRDMQLVGGGSKIRRFCVKQPEKICAHDLECQASDPTDSCDSESFALRNWGRCAFRLNERGKEERCEADVICALQCTENSDCPGFIKEDPTPDQTCVGGVCNPHYCRIMPRLSEFYLGGRVAASVAGQGLESGLLMGETCGSAPLELIDPQAAEYVTLPDGFFNGIYLRGGLTMPVIPGGCAFRVDAALDSGGWMLRGPPLTLGGLVSGAASGKVLCTAGLRGQVTTTLEFSGKKARFSGEAFGVAGTGLDCDPHTWTSVQRSRKDTWCGTVDGKANVVLRNGRWERGGVTTSGVH